MFRRLLSIFAITVTALSGCSSTGAVSTTSSGNAVATEANASTSDDVSDGSQGAVEEATDSEGDEEQTPTPSPVATAAEADPDADSTDNEMEEFLETFERFRWQRVAELGHIPVGSIEASFGSDVFPQRLPAGEYATGVLGTDVSFELTDPAILAREFPGMLSFVDVDLAGTLHIARPNAVYTAEGALSDEIFFNYLTGTESMPEDFDTWLRSISQIDVGSSEEVLVAGQAGTRYELMSKRDDFFFCRRGTCLTLFHVGPDKIQLFGHQNTVLWHVPHPGGDIVIVTKADPERYEEWLAFTESVLDSLSLGEPSASPLSNDQYWSGWGTVGPGAWSTPGLPWSFDFGLPETTLNHKNGYLSASPPAERRGMTVTRFVETRDGLTATLDSIDEVLGEKYEGLPIAELQPEVVLGHEARVFDLGPKPGDLEFKHAVDAPGVDVLGTDNFALVPTPVRMWAFEHEGELWLAFAGAMNEEEFPMTLEWAEGVLDSGFLRPAEPTPLGEESSVVEPGAYLTEALGFPMTIHPEERWVVQANTDGVVHLAAEGGAGSGEYDIVFVQATSPGDGQVGDELESWIDSLPAEVAVGPVTTTSVDERGARMADIRVSQASECARDDTSCDLVFSSGEYEQRLSSDSIYRFVWFQDDAPFIAIIRAPQLDESWLDIGLSLVERATFSPG